MTFTQALRQRAQPVEACLDVLLAAHEVAAPRLFAAMRYAVLGPGKRLRPFLLLETAGLFGVPEVQAIRAAAAIECLHSYSLIHDDLPAMDDDDMRRGQPACHIAFDEATAILAGDSLQALAFQILAEPATHPDPAVRSELVARLAHTAGANGMAGGQMLDLESERENRGDLGAVILLQQMKTGALFSFAVDAGAILGRASPELLRCLNSYGCKIGLAFQITDDILDHTATNKFAIEPTRKEAVGKGTILDILGLAGAKAHAHALAAEAADALAVFGDKATMLRNAARFIVERQQ
jgi:farnesyl diphosphate synthase